MGWKGSFEIILSFKITLLKTLYECLKSFEKHWPIARIQKFTSMRCLYMTHVSRSCLSAANVHSNCSTIAENSTCKVWSSAKRQSIKTWLWSVCFLSFASVCMCQLIGSGLLVVSLAGFASLAPFSGRRRQWLEANPYFKCDKTKATGGCCCYHPPRSPAIFDLLRWPETEIRTWMASS